MEKSVREYIQENNLLSLGDGVVAGVSGGADSMCLLSILLSLQKEYRLQIRVVHINHGIRGESADADEQFVADFCRAHDVPFEAVKTDIPAMAEELGLTEEEAGRNFRYREFVRVAKERGYGKIAVAHNRDDNSETVLFNMFRGSGISGIRGIAPKRETDEKITIIRPLLNTSRKDIEKYLERNHTDYRTDETNLTEDYSRNRIRNVILPLVGQSINSRASEHISELAAQASDIEELVERLTAEEQKKLVACNRLIYEGIAEHIESIRIDIDGLMGLDKVIRNGLVRNLITEIAGSKKDIESTHVTKAVKLINNAVGKRVNLPYNIIVRRDYAHLVIERVGGRLMKNVSAAEPVVSMECAVPSVITLPMGGGILKLSEIPNEKSLKIPKNDYTKYFDYDKINGTITVRTRLTGDYLCVRDKEGSHQKEGVHKKSLKTWMIDRKIPMNVRDTMPLLTVGSHVLWIIGSRGDESFWVTPDTKRILVAELISEGESE